MPGMLHHLRNGKVIKSLLADMEILIVSRQTCATRVRKDPEMCAHLYIYALARCRLPDRGTGAASVPI